MKNIILLVLFFVALIGAISLALIALAHRDLALMLIAFFCALVVKIIPEIAK